MADPTSHFRGLLHQLTMPDTAQIKAAEQALKPLLKDAGCISVLIVSAQSGGLRKVGVRKVRPAEPESGAVEGAPTPTLSLPR
jgi:hypothetical protein